MVDRKTSINVWATISLSSLPFPSVPLAFLSLTGVITVAAVDDLCVVPAPLRKWWWKAAEKALHECVTSATVTTTKSKCPAAGLTL